MHRRILVNSLLALLAVNLAVSAETSADFEATTAIVGRTSDGVETPVNQRTTPAGIQVDLPGTRPNALALSPNGKLLVTSGLKRELLVIDPGTGKILQSVNMPSNGAAGSIASVSSLILNSNPKDKLSFTGLAFSPDGSRIYLSDVNGDLKVFGVSKNKQVSPLFSISLPSVGKPDREEDIPTGIAVSPDEKKLYVALNVGNKLVELDAAGGKVLRTWTVGNAPYDVVLHGKKVYVSNWGGRLPDGSGLVGPIGQNGTVRVDAHSVASEGSVSVIDLTTNSGSETTEISTGRHACALALSPNGKYLACANAGDDTVSVIDTRTDKVVEVICTRQNPGDIFGAQPDALAFDHRGGKLFVCNATQNAVAVIDFDPGGSKVLGLIPVGWFPGGIAYDAHRKMLDVANIKNITPEKQRAGKGHGLGFNTHQFYGSLSLVPVPSNKVMAKFTQTALADLRYPLLARAKLPARPNQQPVPVPERVGEPSVFKHVIYVIKENRTYDQVLGDVKQGNGNADLCIYGERVTPNQHKFVNDFTLLDNTYCSSILSADGHMWAVSGFATDYIEREFAGWPRSYPGGGGELSGRDSMAYSPAGFIWTDAIDHGKTVADFGEFTTDHHRWKTAQRRGPNWTDMYRDFVGHSNNIVYSCEPDIESLRPYVVSNYLGFDLHVPDVYRASCFIEDLKKYEAASAMPDLNIVWLPDDHTSGTGFGNPTPFAQVADNDLAFGQIVDALSHSIFWTNTCIIGIEDDPQDGWDHVSPYRTTAYVISPYTRRHAVVNTQYNHTSLLRTIELILGIPPMNQMDATATPMFDCFTSVPDFAPYDAVTNQVPLDQMNPNPKAIKDAQLRKDAYVSAKLPLDKEDQCPEDVFNQILWRAAKGSHVPYPDWAVNDDK